MLRRSALACVILAGTLFVASIVSTAVAVVRPEWFRSAVSATEAEEISASGTVAWFLSKLSMVPTGPADTSVITVMIENSYAARPNQDGLDQALAVLEMVVEGGITRFAVLFDREELPERAGPVRSLRPYFLHGTEQWSSILYFAGGSPEALEEAPQSSIPAINGLGRPKNFFRDDELYAPHNLFIDAENMRSLMDEFETKTVAWPPYLVGSAPAGEKADTVRLEFYSQSHDVEYAFKGRAYERTNGGMLSEMMPVNVVVLEAPILSIGEKGRLEIPLSEGKMLLFRGGEAYRGTWTLRDNGLYFADQTGGEMRFARGQTWITVLPTLDRVTWE